MDDSYANGLVALAGGGQTGAPVLAATMNRVVTVGTAADSFRLPAASAGLRYYVKNTTGTSMTVYPSLGDVINGLSANAGFAVAAAKSCIFFSCVNGTWETLLTA